MSSLPNEDQDVPNTTIPLQQIPSHIDSTDISEVQATNTTQFESKDVIEFQATTSPTETAAVIYAELSPTLEMSMPSMKSPSLTAFGTVMKHKETTNPPSLQLGNRALENLSYELVTTKGSHYDQLQHEKTKCHKKHNGSYSKYLSMIRSTEEGLGAHIQPEDTQDPGHTLESLVTIDKKKPTASKRHNNDFYSSLHDENVNSVTQTKPMACAITNTDPTNNDSITAGLYDSGSSSLQGLQSIHEYAQIMQPMINAKTTSDPSQHKSKSMLEPSTTQRDAAAIHTTDIDDYDHLDPDDYDHLDPLECQWSSLQTTSSQPGRNDTEISTQASKHEKIDSAIMKTPTTTGMVDEYGKLNLKESSEEYSSITKACSECNSEASATLKSEKGNASKWTQLQQLPVTSNQDEKGINNHGISSHGNKHLPRVTRHYEDISDVLFSHPNRSLKSNSQTLTKETLDQQNKLTLQATHETKIFMGFDDEKHSHQPHITCSPDRIEVLELALPFQYAII